MRSLVIALVFAALAPRAFAQSVVVNDISASTTACVSGTACGSVGTTAQLVLPAASAGLPRQQLTIANGAASGGNSVSCGYSPAIALNGVGTFSLPPLSVSFWPRGTAPANAIYCVASGAATPLLVAPGN